MRDGQLVSQQIRIGINDERNVQVIVGLDPHDSVIVHQAVTAQPTPGSRGAADVGPVALGVPPLGIIP